MKNTCNPNFQGLPTDRMSAENASIMINSSRWPLLIDPQLQGLKWIKNKYGDALKILRLSQRNYLDQIESAIVNGDTVLLENIMETVDAVLDPILGRVLVKKGRYDFSFKNDESQLFEICFSTLQLHQTRR